MAAMDGRVAAIVLAAGAGSRFGGGKLLATVDGRPLLQHALDRLAEAGIGDVVVVLGDDAAAIEAAIEWRAERRVVNPEPERGLSSSLAIGRAALGEGTDGVLIALGDQPTLRTDVIRSLLGAPTDRDRPVVVPAYAEDRGRNPVLVRSAGFALLDEATGDRGLGPILAAHPERVLEVPVAGFEPGRGHACGPGRRAGGGMGRAGPGQSRAGGPAPRGPRRAGLLRPGERLVPGRPGPDRRTGPRRPAGAGHGLARRGSTSGRARAGMPCRSPRRLGRRAGRSSRSTHRPGCWTRFGRMPRRRPSRTSGSSKAAGRRRTRRRSPPMSR